MQLLKEIMHVFRKAKLSQVKIPVLAVSLGLLAVGGFPASFFEIIAGEQSGKTSGFCCLNPRNSKHMHLLLLLNY